MQRCFAVPDKLLLRECLIFLYLIVPQLGMCWPDLSNPFNLSLIYLILCKAVWEHVLFLARDLILAPQSADSCCKRKRR